MPFLTASYDEFDPFGSALRPIVDAAVAAPSGAKHTPYEQLLEKLRLEAGSHFSHGELDQGGTEVETWIARRGAELVREYNDLALSKNAPRIALRPGAEPGPTEAIVRRMLHEILGLGPIEDLLQRPGLEDIAINGPHDVWVKGAGGWEPTSARFSNSHALLNLLNRAIVHTGRQAGPQTPIVDAHLKDGSRINIVTAPLADPWPAAVIRKHAPTTLTLKDLVARGGGAVQPSPPARLPNYFAPATSSGVFTPLAATFLHMAVVAGLNILVIGATGVGKTTVIGALGQLIPADRRIIVIEDTRELIMRLETGPGAEGRATEGPATGWAGGEGPALGREVGGTGGKRAGNCVYFTTRPAGLEGTAAVKQDALVRAALRQRPDALTVGEARGAEVFDLLKALWTGHGNGLTSIHAEALSEVTERMRMMLQEADLRTRIDDETVSLWIAKAFHLGVTLRLSPNGRRYVHEIVEFTGVVEGRAPALNRLFAQDPDSGRLARVSGRMHHEALLQRAGYSFDMIRDHREAG